MKKTLTNFTMLLIALTMSTSLMADGTQPTGSGTSGDPYQVSILDNLLWISTTSVSWSSYFEQTAIIDASTTSGWNSGAGFSPIGNSTIKFTGSYDGQDYTIDGLYISRSATDDIGLFGFVEGGEIKNIIVTNVNITGHKNVGGLAGQNSTNSTITDCYSTGSVSGQDVNTGGLVGYNYDNSSITKCYSIVNVTGTDICVGGLVGYNHNNSTITQCYSIGNVSGSANRVGGFVGWNYLTSSISDCYSLGNVTRNSGTSVRYGGFIGQNSATIQNCYSTGNVTYTGTTDPTDKGFSGYNTGGTYINNFWDSEASNQTTATGGTGKTTTEMKTQSTFTDAGWDFLGETANGENDYCGMAIGINDGYVYLTMQKAVWTGTSGSVWNLEGNWSVDAIPPAVFDITIPNVTNDPVIATDGTVTCNNLTVESGASLTIQSSASGTGSLITTGAITNNGTVNIQRYVTESVWHLISVPNNVTTANTFLGDYLQTYTESTDTWTDIVETSTLLNAGQGYALWGVSKISTYTFTGTPNTGDVSRDYTYTPGGNPDHYGFNLMGNPYPSSIDWDLLNETYGAVYYYNGSAYVSWNGSGAGSQYIPPMQGFMIAPGSAGTLNLDNAHRTHSGASTYYKSTGNYESNIVLQAGNEIYKDELFVNFNKEAGEGFDLPLDAWKILTSEQEVAQLYSFTGNQMLSIDNRPECEVIQLGFQCGIGGSFTFSIKEMNGLTKAILEDTKTGTFHNLQTGSYEFIWDVNDNEKRFKLHLNAVGIDENITQHNETLIYAVGQTIYIKNQGSPENVLVKISDITGRIVLEKSIRSTGLTAIPTNLKSGVYIVSLISKNKIEIEKILIK